MATKIIKVESCYDCPHFQGQNDTHYDSCKANNYKRLPIPLYANQYPEWCKLEEMNEQLPVPKSILIEYDGKYPNLCSGQLFATIDGKVWKFPSHCLSSGGGCNWSNDEESTRKGEWSINEWPENFPNEYKKAVTDAVNDQVSPGCCGGCN